MDDDDDNDNNCDDVTLSYIRYLTRPLINQPICGDELKDMLIDPWDVCIPVDTNDNVTCIHWKEQNKQTIMCKKMFDWNNNNNNASNNNNTVTTAASSTTTTTTQSSSEIHSSSSTRKGVKLHPYFTFGIQKGNPFFAPHEDVLNCLKNLLLHQIGSHHISPSSSFVSLQSHDIDMFISTDSSSFVSELDLKNIRFINDTTSINNNKHNYLLRCHYDKHNQQLEFGYHHNDDSDDNRKYVFHKLHIISLDHDENWRCKVCIILKNITRILHVLKDYTIPLTCNTSKLSLVFINKTTKSTTTKSTTTTTTTNAEDNNITTTPCSSTFSSTRSAIQKVYYTNRICNTFNASVSNMISIYNEIETNISKSLPKHTDKIISVIKVQQQQQEEEGERENEQQSSITGANSAGTTATKTSKTICIFAPIGRTYLPENISELLDALICVTETLVAIHSINIMHRDIRWANIFHAFTTEEESNKEGSSNNNNNKFSNEWILFDFEFACKSPQSSLGEHTLTIGNHAPEMIDHDHIHNKDNHTTKVDIWGLGYLISTCYVDIPSSHKDDLSTLKNQCMTTNPNDRPNAIECLNILTSLRNNKPCTNEKDIINKLSENDAVSFS